MGENKEIEEFISYIREDLMEIYNVSAEDATTLLNNFKIRELIEKHGEQVAHYPTEELAKMVYKKKVLQNH